MKHPKLEGEVIALIRPTCSTYDATTYGHVDVTFRTVNPHQQPESLYHLDYVQEGWPFAVPYLAKLEVHCQYDDDKASWKPDERVYAQRVRYYNAEVDSVESAQAIAATLTRIDRYLGRAYEQHGAPLSYGQYVARVCQALGVQRMATEATVEQRVAFGHFYRYFTLGEGVAHIDKLIADFFAAHSTTQAARDVA